MDVLLNPFERKLLIEKTGVQGAIGSDLGGG
jgi:hypothetical protein